MMAVSCKALFGGRYARSFNGHFLKIGKVTTPAIEAFIGTILILHCTFQGMPGLLIFLSGI